MTPYQNHLQLLMSCQDQVARLPTAGVVLGHTPTCPVGLFRVGERMLGIQGHPEFSKTYTRALLESRRERLGEDVCTAGIDSLDQPLDAGVVAEWVMRFLMLRS